MALKKLELLVPEEAILSIDSFTPEQNYIMLKIRFMQRGLTIFFTPLVGLVGLLFCRL